MSALILSYRCPITSNEVVTGIDTDASRLARMGALKVSISCPHCLAGHSIPATAMFFGALSADQPIPTSNTNLSNNRGHCVVVGSPGVVGVALTDTVEREYASKLRYIIPAPIGRASSLKTACRNNRRAGERSVRRYPFRSSACGCRSHRQIVHCSMACARPPRPNRPCNFQEKRWSVNRSPRSQCASSPQDAQSFAVVGRCSQC
jgi:hypothetical protein